MDIGRSGQGRSGQEHSGQWPEIPGLSGQYYGPSGQFNYIEELALLSSCFSFPTVGRHGQWSIGPERKGRHTA